ncbi:ATP-binding protein [Paraburkholderia sp. BR10882]|uniref:hybrid sensor histidine kinase/response regulator n=1 Tax=unclassified Paraburkholderia TaxID=2615204 RepID=UPI0034D02202
MNVLLAVDNVRVARHLEAGLLKAGHCVEFAETGRKRIFLAAIETYDAIIWNRNLPGTIAGIGVVSTLRSSSNEIPILLISEPASASERARDSTEGATDRDDDPAQFAELVAWLDVLIGSSRGRTPEAGRSYGSLRPGNRETIHPQTRLDAIESMLAQVQRLSETESWWWNIETGEICPSLKIGAMLRLLAKGTPHQTISGSLEAIHSDDRTRVSAVISEAIEKRQDFDVQFRIVDEDAVRYFRTVGEGRRRQNGDLFYLCSSMDVTGRERRKEALCRAEAEIAHLARVHALGKVTSSIVHEVNQPLSAIVTYGTAALHWLHREPPDVDEASIAMNRIIRDATRARDVITRIRRLSKNGMPQKARFSITEIIEETLTLLARDLHTRHIAIEYAVSHALPAVSGDRVQIQQVLINLILNAIESLEAAHSQIRIITVSAEAVNTGQLRVVVRDNGPGVAPDARERLFEPFFSTKDEGLGMGLSVCRSIIEAHNGALALLSMEEPGAAFEFVLPVTQTP